MYQVHREPPPSNVMPIPTSPPPPPPLLVSARHLSGTCACVHHRLTAPSVIVATALGMLIPALASIIPIRSALSQNLQDCLDTRHSKTKVVEFTINRADATDVPWTLVLCGGFMVTIAFLIYYLFPLSLLTLNILLLFYMFFGLLLSMLFGLILLSLNLESILEKLCTTVFLFWENPAIQALVTKNLVAHRKRNRKTTLMYAISLAFIIFVSVSFDLQVETYRYQSLRSYGTEVIVQSRRGGIPLATAIELEKVAIAHPLVKTFTWVTHQAADTGITTDIATIGRFKSGTVSIYGVSPNFYEVTDAKFMIPRTVDSTSGLSLSEQMYTIRGSQSLLLGSTYIEHLKLQNLSAEFVLKTTLKAEITGDTSKEEDAGAFLDAFVADINNPIKYEVFVPLGFIDAAPVMSVSKFPSQVNQDLAISIPTYIRLARAAVPDFSVQDISFGTMHVSLTDPDTNKTALDALKAVFKGAAQVVDPEENIDIRDVNNAMRSIVRSQSLIQLFFAATTIVAMIMCFFSLTSSMLTNVYEQSKEIGVMRALGLGRFPLIRLYIFEARPSPYSSVPTAQIRNRGRPSWDFVLPAGGLKMGESFQCARPL